MDFPKETLEHLKSFFYFKWKVCVPFPRPMFIICAFAIHAMYVFCRAVTLYIHTYIYIYIYVYVCVCVIFI